MHPICASKSPIRRNKTQFQLKFITRRSRNPCENGIQITVESAINNAIIDYVHFFEMGKVHRYTDRKQRRLERKRQHQAHESMNTNDEIGSDEHEKSVQSNYMTTKTTNN